MFLGQYLESILRNISLSEHIKAYLLIQRLMSQQ